MKKKPGPKSLPIAGPDTLNGELWKKIRPLLAPDLKIEDARIVQAVATLPFDSGGNLLRALLPRRKGDWPAGVSSCAGESFIGIFAKSPRACIAVMVAVVNYMEGRGAVARAVAGDEAVGGQTSPDILADQLSAKNIAVTASAISKQRGRLKSGSRDLHKAEAEEKNADR